MSLEEYVAAGDIQSVMCRVASMDPVEIRTFAEELGFNVKGPKKIHLVISLYKQLVFKGAF